MTERRLPPHHHDRRYMKRTEMDGKADAEHTHEQADVAGLVALLESLQDQIDALDLRVTALEPEP